MKNLIIRTVTNGFIVSDDAAPGFVPENEHVFQSTQGLAEYVHEWADKNKEYDDEPAVTEDIIHKLVKGRALLILGDEGIGKTILAGEIARDNGGSVVTTTYGDMICSAFSMSRLLTDEPDTVIVENFELTPRDIDFITSWVVHDSMPVPRQYQQPLRVNTPNFILCSSDRTPLNIESLEGRFTIIDLNK